MATLPNSTRATASAVSSPSPTVMYSPGAGPYCSTTASRMPGSRSSAIHAAYSPAGTSAGSPLATNSSNAPRAYGPSTGPFAWTSSQNSSSVAGSPSTVYPASRSARSRFSRLGATSRLPAFMAFLPGPL